jgi:transcriptional regulator with XRE-family HTH domain
MNESSVILKLRRRCRGTTQARVAADIGISPQLLCDVLKGRRAPGPAILRALGLEGRRIYRPTNGKG